MQNEWLYVQRVVADTAPFFSPLEEVIPTHFLPALLGVPLVEIDGEYRQLLTHSVKLASWGGWQSATLWTQPPIFTRPLLQQLVT
jgi:hypothetical protein